MRRVTVPLGNRQYEIWLGDGLLARLGRACRGLGLGRRCAIFTDSRVGPRYGELVLRVLRTAGFEPVYVTVPAGERSKSLEVATRCYRRLAAHRLERGSFVVALGGGVVGDLAGFIAATYLRGLAWVQVPTTLLAQVDSSVGGKVGVNLPAGKNLVGAFHQPRFVLGDLATLKSLPEREYRAGLAEVIKYGIIRDAALFRLLERRLPSLMAREPRSLAAVVQRCCEIKAEVVGQDETEGGLRAILNFGHTLGHALEAISGYGRYLHGEAIAIGQVWAARLSVCLLGLPESEAARIQDLLARAGLPTEARLSRRQQAALFAAMQHDKKVQAGVVRFVLIRRIGEAVPGQAVAPGPLRALWAPRASSHDGGAPRGVGVKLESRE